VTITSAHRRAKPGKPAPATGTPVVRVAIYCRQSVTKDESDPHGSVGTQREAAEDYVASQKSLGWRALPARYDDLGLSGKNTDRPAFQRMLADIEAGQIDVVAVYKIDRLSRSVADFTRLMEDFDRRGVTFVSVTQAFDTRTSMGRLTLNILGSFAQFEREQIADRVRDSMLAARKRGAWTGGRPLLGYDIVDGALVVNEPEAAIVRELFLSYLQRRSLNAVVDECRRRGITNKTFTNRRGERVQGGPIAKTTLRALLSNPLFVGRINADGEAVPGDQKAIVDEQTWDAVQALLDEHGAPGRDRPRTEWRVPLLGLLRCGVCGSAMTHSTTRRAGRAHSSFVCVKAQKQGAAACPGSRAPSPQMVAAVVERIRAIGSDQAVFDATLAACRKQLAVAPAARDAERRRLRADRDRLGAERAGLAHALAQPGFRPEALAARLAEVDATLASMQENAMGPHLAEASPGGGFGGPEALRGSLRRFGPVWDALLPAEQARLLALLIETVTFDARSSSLTIAFRPTGILKLAHPEEVP
jgi:site-specific DNA recombinase